MVLLNRFHYNSEDENKIKMYYDSIKKLIAYIFAFFAIMWYLFCITICTIVIYDKYPNSYHAIVGYMVSSSFFSLFQMGLFFC